MDYLYIRAWGRLLNSAPYYVKDQVEKANRDGAPANAIYYSDKEKRWHTFDEVANSLTRFQIENILDEYKRSRGKS